jgi:uroporphyrin-III C-methyltransferase
MSFVEDARWFAAPPAAGASARTGRVTLVGAGPGDPELLTLRAVKALRGARLVLYDHLVGKEVLRYVADDADLIYVGKEAAHHTLPQESIIDLMVRLKGGDGFIFGRGGEEAQALADAGIAFDVVPGITAAQGAGACAGIPLTHRDHAATLVFATGHLQGDGEVALDWQALARPRQTVVIYMGIGNLPVICAELVRHGLPQDTPAALVEQASLPGQRCIEGTLQSLPQLALQHRVRPPALIVVGGVVALRPQLLKGLQAMAA